MAARVLESRHDRHVLAEIGAEQYHAGDVGPALELFAQDRRGAIAAAVVDEDQFVAGAERIERRIDAVEQRLQAGFLVIDRDDDRDFGRHARAPSRISAVASHTRSTSSTRIAANSGSVTVSRPMRSLLGN